MENGKLISQSMKGILGMIDRNINIHFDFQLFNRFAEGKLITDKFWIFLETKDYILRHIFELEYITYYNKMYGDNVPL